MNFFRVLRDQKYPLIEAIGLTPFSREELALASLRHTEGITELERDPAILADLVVSIDRPYQKSKAPITFMLRASCKF